LRLAKLKTNVGGIDVPKLELSAHGTFAFDDLRFIRQTSVGGQVDDILDLRFSERGKRQIAGFRHDGVLRRRYRGGGGKEGERVEARRWEMV
jgi:hypothetical protein